MLHFKSILRFALIAVILVPAVLSAQPGQGPGRGGGRNNEKIRQMKKMKMLEVLDLDENVANQFLIIYDKYEKKREKHHQEFGKLNSALKEEVKDSPSSKKAAELADKIVAKHPEMIKIEQDMYAEMEKLLPEAKYVKFVYFEMNFHREVMRAMWKKGQGRHRGGNDDMPPPPPDDF